MKNYALVPVMKTIKQEILYPSNQFDERVKSKITTKILEEEKDILNN